MHERLHIDDIQSHSPICPWCGAEVGCRHRVARFDGELVRLEGNFAHLAGTIRELITEAFDCIVDGDPVPAALTRQGLPDGEDFLNGLERSWSKMRRHAADDGDVEGWLALFSSETQFQSAEWVLGLIWALGEGPIQIEDGNGGEYWYCGAPNHLMEALAKGLELPFAEDSGRAELDLTSVRASGDGHIRICGG